MRYITRDLERKMQFFGIAFEDMDLQSLAEEWSHSDRPLDVYKIFYESIEYTKKDMLRLLPKDLKNKIFNGDGNIKNDILNSEFYDEMVNYNRKVKKEWENAWKIVMEEEKRIYAKLPKTIKQLVKLSMHDENVFQIFYHNNKELVIELAESRWGKTSLIFKGIEKVDIRNDLYPAWWLYEELFELEGGKYEYNVLFQEGEISIVFTEFKIVTQTKKYLAEIIADFSPAAVNAKINEIVRQSIEIDGCPLEEATISNLKSMMFDDFGLYRAILSCIVSKKHFAGSNRLSKLEKDILLFDEVISDLLFSSFSVKYGERKFGVQNLRKYSRSKLDRIIKLMSKTGPEYLYKILIEAKSIFGDQDEENVARNIKRLNSKIKRKFSKDGRHINEAFGSFVCYLKLNEHKF